MTTEVTASSARRRYKYGYDDRRDDKTLVKKKAKMLNENYVVVFSSGEVPREESMFVAMAGTKDKPVQALSRMEARIIQQAICETGGKGDALPGGSQPMSAWVLPLCDPALTINPRTGYVRVNPADFSLDRVI